MELNKENVLQAVVVMDTFNHNFDPVSKAKPMGLVSASGVPLIEFALESLARGGVGETILFCCQDGSKIKEYIKNGQANKLPWAISMEVQVILSDTCQTVGDVLREIDAAGLIRGYFVLMGVNTITNINFATLMEEHKNSCKNDRGAAMTLVYKKVAWEHPLISNDKPVFIAADSKSSKVLAHQRYKTKSKEKSVSLPLGVLLSHSEVKLHHNLVDANIALCSPSVPPLFSDNFDFQTRDDLIHGIIINEEILASSLYCTILKENQYAAAITNWKTYQVVSHDILHFWTHPLTIELGSIFKNMYAFMGNHTFRHRDSTLSRSCTLVEDVLIGAQSQINDNTSISKSIIGKKCRIGKNVLIVGSHIMDNVTIEDNCKINYSYIDNDCVIGENSTLNRGSILSVGVKVKPNSEMHGNLLDSELENNEKTKTKSTSESGTEWENESSNSDADEFVGFEKKWSDSESCYSSDTSDESSLAGSSIPDDTNIFLQEVVDSLARGYDEKLKCDYLILEINSSRYAYNIQLHEVNFFVVRALLSLPVLTQAKNVLSTVKDIIKYFYPVVVNYIKTKTSIMDCLRAVEDSCIKCEWLDNKCGQILHLLYDADIVDEDSLTEWYEDLQENESPIAKQTSMVKFFEWLQEASEESDD